MTDCTVFSIRGMNVPSSKNSKSWTGKMLIKSKLCQSYEKWFINYTRSMTRNMKDEFSRKRCPVNLHIRFFFKDKRRRDLINIAQLPLDLLQKIGVLEDDDYTHIYPVFEDVVIDKKNPGFEFWITERDGED